MASAWRAATSMTRGPVAATSTGTFGACTRSSHSRRLAKPPRSTASPQRYPCKAARWRSKLATRSSRLPMRCTEESPRPIPRTARPPLSAWRASAAEAVTAGSRVTELVTPGPRWTRVVACAASMSWPQTSGARFWLSGKRTVSKPSSSRRRAVRADRRGSGTARTPNSILGGCRSNHAGCGERSGGCERREVDAVELGDVLAEDRAPLLRGERAGVLGQHVRVRRLGHVRVGRDDRVAHDARPRRSTRPGSGPSGSTASRRGGGRGGRAGCAGREGGGGRGGGGASGGRPAARARARGGGGREAGRVGGAPRDPSVRAEPDDTPVRDAAELFLAKEFDLP